MQKYDVGPDFSNSQIEQIVEINQFPELGIINSVHQMHEHDRAIPWGVKTGGSVGSRILVQDGVAYFGSNDHNLYAVSITNGALLWKYGIDDLVSVYSSPVIYRDRIIFSGYNGIFYCIGIDGKRLFWKFSANDKSISTPLLDNERLFFGSRDGNLYCIDANNGEIIWRLSVNQEINCSPVKDGSGHQYFD